MFFSRRTDWPLTSNQYSTELENIRQKNIPLFDLTESNPTRCEFLYLKDDLIVSVLGNTSTDYVPSPQGQYEARQAICDYYQEKGQAVTPDQIFLTSSTSEAYSYLFRLLADPDEQVLFPCPSYPLFAFLGDLNDVQMGTYPLVYDGQWRVDFKAVHEVLSGDLKAFVIVNPNNPTGTFIKAEELKNINEICQKEDTAIISDEVFSDYAFDLKKKHLSLVNNDQVLTFVLGGISKTLGLPQMKLSWIIINGPQHLIEQASARLEVIADTYLSVNTPVQNAIPQWLAHRRTIQDEINQRISANFNALKVLVNSAEHCELLSADGGWYAVLTLQNHPF